jgi:hypothetical protein
MEGKGGSNTTIDQMVADRNEDALYYTNIEEVIYDYYPDDDKYNFSCTFDIMYNEIHNPNLNSPDMYCNYITDMFVLSLKGCFANLYSRSRGANHFDLSDTGYMADAMSSSTINIDKVYLIVSDYFIDTVRSFYCIPVNVELYNKTVNNNLCSDYNNDTVLNIDDLFAQVKKGEWTYAKLMDYCAAVYKDTNTDKAGEDLKDTLGFALAHNAIPAKALVYTSSVCFITKQYESGGFNYSYAQENSQLYNLAGAIQSLAEAKGVTCVSSGDAYAATGNYNSLLAIRTQFTSGKMLFGGIEILGNLENSSYREMIDDGDGFGIIPVPVYKSGDGYLTQMHHTARVGAISTYTQKFTECTAFLHYQSTNSSDILYQYADAHFIHDIVYDLDGNVEMLKYMRSNLRNSFDMLLEDAIGFLYESQGESLLNSDRRWHALIANAFYKKADIRTDYTQLALSKNAYLGELIHQYASLTNQ